MKKLVVIGANSNVGKQVLVQLGRKYEITPIARVAGGSNCRFKQVEDFRHIPDEYLANSDVVLNCVGSSRPRNLKDLSIVNKEIPLSIATAAKRVGVKHFIHISSVKVYGHQERIDDRTVEAPVSNYGRTKLFGDQAIKQLHGRTFMVSIFRPPVLYGFGTGVNLVRVARFMNKTRFFVTLGDAVQRSILHLPNLVSAIEKVIEQRGAGIFLVADQEAMTLQMIAGLVSGASKKQVRILKIPKFLGFPISVLAKETYFSLFGHQVVETTKNIGSFSSYQGQKDSKFSDFIRESVLK